MKLQHGILTLAASLALASCASDNTAWRSSSQADTSGMSTGYQSDTTANTGATGLPDNPQVGASDKMRAIAGPISAADTAFVRDAEAGNQYEVSAAQKALFKSSNQQIKDLAQHMSDDHQKANSQLTNLAMRKGLPDTASMNLDQINLLSKLDSLNGADFDREYVNQQLDAHKETINKFQAAASNADDKDIRDWAAVTLPTLQNHLTMVQEESRQLNDVTKDGM